MMLHRESLIANDQIFNRLNFYIVFAERKSLLSLLKGPKEPNLIL